MPKTLLTAFLVLAGFSLYARQLVITVDGTGSQLEDTLSLLCFSELTGTNFLASANDSITVTWNEDKKLYEVFSPRYPGNSTLYKHILAIHTPDTRYKRDMDNYNDYVKAVDSTTAIRYKILSDARQLSADVYNNAKAFINAMHLYGLLKYRTSPTFIKQFPKSPGKYVSVFTDSIFNFPYIDAEMFQGLAVSHYVNTIAKLADSSNAKNYALDYAWNHFSGYAESLLGR